MAGHSVSRVSSLWRRGQQIVPKLTCYNGHVLVRGECCDFHQRPMDVEAIEDGISLCLDDLMAREVAQERPRHRISLVNPNVSPIRKSASQYGVSIVDRG
jgi:hypothetical protein